MKCKICNSDTKKIFEKKVLLKYDVTYLRCNSCLFVQTENPYWLDEAYASAITSLDIGLPYRNILLRTEIEKIIDSFFPESSIYLDYAGGYGLFVRLMRDNGFDFYRQDDYCDNLFAKHFDITDLKLNRFDLVTAFEVLEHFKNPIEEIAKIFEFSDSVIFTTDLAPETVEEIENWWYIAQETGQHIAFYNKKSMEFIANKFNKNYYCKDGKIHIFTSKVINDYMINYAFYDIKRYEKKNFWSKTLHKNYQKERESLLNKDFQYIKSLLNK